MLKKINYFLQELGTINENEYIEFSFSLDYENSGRDSLYTKIIDYDKLFIETS